MRVVLGVGGGIAAYKAAELARLLQQAGHEVQVVMTARSPAVCTTVDVRGAHRTTVITGLFSGGEPRGHAVERGGTHLGGAGERRFGGCTRHSGYSGEICGGSG